MIASTPSNSAAPAEISLPGRRYDWDRRRFLLLKQAPLK